MRAAWLLATGLSLLLLLMAATQLILRLINAPPSLTGTPYDQFIPLIALALSLFLSIAGRRYQWGSISLGLVFGTIVGIGALVLSLSESAMFAVPAIVTGLVAGTAIDVIGPPIGRSGVNQWLRGSLQYGIDRPERPKLTIWYLLAWSACSAVYFSIETAITRHFDPNSAIDISLTVGNIVPYALWPLYTGIAFAGFILWASCRWRRDHFPFYPGEYVWIFLGFHVVQRLIPNVTSWPINVVSVVLSAAMLGLAVLAVIRIRQWNWRLLFITLAIATVLRPYFVIMFLRFNASAVWSVYGVSAVVELFVAMTLLLSVIRDYAKGHRFPWPHWVGIIVLLMRNVAWLNTIFVGLIDFSTTPGA